jgi:protein TonB
LLNYINGSLNPADAAAIEHHLSHCEICTDVVEGLRLINTTEDFHSNIQQLNKMIDRSIQKKKRIHFFTPLRSVAAAILFLLAFSSVLVINKFSNKIDTDKVGKIEYKSNEENTLQDDRFVSESEPVFKDSNREKNSESAPSGGIMTEKAKDYTVKAPVPIINKQQNNEEYFSDDFESDIPQNSNTRVIQDEEDQIGESADHLFSPNTETQKGMTGESNGDGAGSAIDILSDEEEMLVLEENRGKNDELTETVLLNEVVVVTNQSSLNQPFEDAMLSGSNKKERNVRKEQSADVPQEISTAEQEYKEELEIVEDDNINFDMEMDKTVEEIVPISDSFEEDTPISFAVVEEKPQYPGGDEALMKYIAENIEYPQIARESSIQGKVFVSFIIDSTGEVINPVIVNSIDPILDSLALDVVRNIPDWTPGKQRGKAVQVSYIIPITFILY